MIPVALVMSACLTPFLIIVRRNLSGKVGTAFNSSKKKIFCDTIAFEKYYKIELYHLEAIK